MFSLNITKSFLFAVNESHLSLFVYEMSPRDPKLGLQ